MLIITLELLVEYFYYTLVQNTDQFPPKESLVSFIKNQIAVMPPPLLIPLHGLALMFNLHCLFKYFSLFKHLNFELRGLHITTWKISSFSFARDFVLYFETLATLAFYDSLNPLEKPAC